jgi:hypothetical protein
MIFKLALLLAAALPAAAQFGLANGNSNGNNNDNGGTTTTTTTTTTSDNTGSDIVIIEGNRGREDVFACDICAGGGAALLVLNDSTRIGNQDVDGTALVQLVTVTPAGAGGLDFEFEGLVSVDITTSSRSGTVDAQTMGYATCTDSADFGNGPVCVGLSFNGMVTIPANSGTGYFSNRQCEFTLNGSLLVGREPFETQTLVGDCFVSAGSN